MSFICNMEGWSPFFILKTIAVSRARLAISTITKATRVESFWVCHTKDGRIVIGHVIDTYIKRCTVEELMGWLDGGIVEFVWK